MCAHIKHRDSPILNANNRFWNKMSWTEVNPLYIIRNVRGPRCLMILAETKWWVVYVLWEFSRNCLANCNLRKGIAIVGQVISFFLTPSPSLWYPFSFTPSDGQNSPLMGETFLWWVNIFLSEWRNGWLADKLHNKNLNLQPDEATLFVLGLRGKEIGY